jgi:hypothetical protein
MSTEKVRRYDMQTDWFKHEHGKALVAKMVGTPHGRYIEYADVAGLVEALKEARAELELANQQDGLEPYNNPRINDELARWQS